MISESLYSTESSGFQLLEECNRLQKVIKGIGLKYRYLSPDIRQESNVLLDQSNLSESSKHWLINSSSGNTRYPFVLLLGNHSSGKSSFINYLLKRKIQSTGVAPTDDGFTVIASGPEDADRDGPSLVGDPDLGFSGLKSFGNVLVNHTIMKIRKNTAIKDFIIVDSPGMIDSPTSVVQSSDSTASVSTHDGNMDRGYNFEGVCRWYAERADVILLFFDPDKPGTTGETLSILTKSLVGLDHKLHIVLNKADQFRRIHDFARAYGSLCWNLSKVIPRKDLPKIHTMCLPLHLIQDNESEDTLSSSSSQPDLNSTDKNVVAFAAQRKFLEQSIGDLEESREEVIREVFNAPKRRVDNEITRLTDTVTTALMHCRVYDEVVHKYQSHLWKCRLATASVSIISAGVTALAGFVYSFFYQGSSTSNDISSVSALQLVVTTVGADSSSSSTTSSSSSNNSNVTNAADLTKGASSTAVILFDTIKLTASQTILAISAGVSTLSTLAMSVYQHFSMKKYCKLITQREEFDAIYKKLYTSDISTSKAETSTDATARKVIQDMRFALNPANIYSAKRVILSDFHALHTILHNDIPNLRRKAMSNYSNTQNHSPTVCQDFVSSISRSNSDGTRRPPPVVLKHASSFQVEDLENVFNHNQSSIDSRLENTETQEFIANELSSYQLGGSSDINDSSGSLDAVNIHRESTEPVVSEGRLSENVSVRPKQKGRGKKSQ